MRYKFALVGIKDNLGFGAVDFEGPVVQSLVQGVRRLLITSACRVHIRSLVSLCFFSSPNLLRRCLPF